MKQLIHTFFQPLKSQQGALFGMDARIALIIASVLVGTGAVTIMSRLERSKVLQAESTMEELRKGLEIYYKTISINYMPLALDDLFAEGVVDNVTSKLDPWNKPWQYSFFEAPVTLEGTPVNMHYAVIYSTGKDGVNQSSGVTDLQDYVNWSPSGDDIGIKFSTRDIELSRLEEYRARGQLITDKITAYESAQYLQATGVCESTTPADFCDNIDGKNYTQLNYYPQSDLDEIEGVVYYGNISEGLAPLTAGDITDMETLLTRVGLPASYAKDPWGRVLFYHSNVTESVSPPFTAGICFSDGGSCF